MGLIDWEVQRFLPFNFRLKGNHTRVEEIAKQLAGQFDFQNRKIDNKMEYLKCLLLNLKISWDTKRYIAISLDANHYSKTPARYRRSFQNYRTVRNVVDEMINYGYIDFVKGYKEAESGRGVPSKIKPIDNFGEVLSSLIDYNMFEEIRPEEVIVLRDKDKVLVDYEDTPEIEALRNELIAYNNLRENTKLRIKGIPYDDLITYRNEIQPFSTVQIDKIEDRANIDIELKKTYLSRIFNNNSFIQGGRYYRGAESVLPEEVRKYFGINDRETCELDYDGFHLRMTYNLLGKSVNGDPYVISEKQPVHMRKFYKKISLIMLNAENENNALRGITNEYRGSDYRIYVPDLTHNTLRKHCNALIEANRDIKTMFYSGIGVKLQYRDSIISSRILKHFAEQEILVLCIHDSYIIDNRYKDELKAAMEREYLAVFPGFPPVIK